MSVIEKCRIIDWQGVIILQAAIKGSLAAAG
jgi:hypothetical protein